MCGIVGYLRIHPDKCGPLHPDVTRQMLRAVGHRGPDGEGQWQSSDRCCWLGHRRLAIIDVATGQQPLANETRDVWTTFNGEIYNYKQLRAELSSYGHQFRTTSDTEVLVHGYEQWGGEGLVKRLQGIFAFAIYDQRRRRLFLARDHLGVKPLYWWTDGDLLLFGSEIKSLLPYSALRKRKVNVSGVAQFLVCRYVSRPNTIFQDISKLPEASWVEVEVGSSNRLRPNSYWDVTYCPKSPLSFADAKEQLDSLLTRTVEMQMMSDVPIGAQLSGGVDSSIVVALMDKVHRRQTNSERIKTFSVGFDEARYNELPYAKKVAHRYGTHHFEIVMNHKDFIDSFAALCWIYDEPIGEPPAIPTYFMCKAAKKEVSVMLCGEGADEQFGGYSKYAFDSFSRYIDWMPAKARQVLLSKIGAAVPFSARRLRSIAEILALSDRVSRFTSWYGAFDTTTQTKLLSDNLKASVADIFLTDISANVLGMCGSEHPLDQFMYCDIHTRLVDDILVKSDRMSMGAGVEARVPFLDHHVVEFAAKLPAVFKVKGLRTKILLKSLAERYAPYELIYRRKVGFTVPLSNWFVGPLRNYIKNVLLDDRCLSRGYWNPDELKKIVNEHLERKVDREQGLWVLLALEIWHRLFIDNDGSKNAVNIVQAEMADSIVKEAA